MLFIWVSDKYDLIFVPKREMKTCLADAPGLLRCFRLWFPCKSRWRQFGPVVKRFPFVCISFSFCVSGYFFYDPHILVKVDIFCSKSVDELLVVRWEPSKGNREEEEKEWHVRVSKKSSNKKKKIASVLTPSIKSANLADPNQSSSPLEQRPPTKWVPPTRA